MKSANSVRHLQLSELIAERRDLERRLADACDATVIPLLANCLAFFEESKRSTKIGRCYRAQIQHYHRTNDVVLGGRTAARIINVVACVFHESGSDAPRVLRASIYCQVLRKAIASGVTSATLPLYIADCGGIRAIAGPTKAVLAIANEDLGREVASGIYVPEDANP